ncbi:MAG: hypothetical protein AB8F74_13005 [Saprospiraceae bacterium]
MIKRITFFLFVFTLLSTIVFAQKQYSYMTDRIFKDQLDLYGYNFVPNRMEIPNESAEDLKMGEYSFGIMGANLYVDGGDMKGVYSINNIDPANYGFKLNLMNARDPTVQGHLKIIQTKYGHVDALVFKRSTKDKEIIFFLPEIPKTLRIKEKDYFTDRWETPLANIDDLWGQSFRPFMRIHDDQNIQERLQLKDSTTITFIEVITKTEKKERGKLFKRKKDKEENEGIELALPDDEEVIAETEAEEKEGAVEVAPEPELEPEPAVAAAAEKPKGRSARKRQKFGGYQSSTTTTSYDEEEVVIEKPKPKPDAPKKEAKEIETEVTEAEPIDEGASPAMGEEDGKEYKITKTYFVKVRSILTYDDGTTGDVEETFPVRKIVEREDVEAGPEEERFQLEISLKKGDPIYLYLTGERTISSVEADGKTYLMRGH